jgi:16S rRNA (cytosine967-C5)-methyltransferase
MGACAAGSLPSWALELAMKRSHRPAPKTQRAKKSSAKKPSGRDSKRPAPATPGAPDRTSSERAARPLREDLVLQACLEAYGSVRHEGRLSDRALDFTLRRKAHLYSTERRAVAERVYALLRRQRTVDWLLARARPGFDRLETTRQDVLRLAASRILHGEPLEAVVRASSLPSEDGAALHALPEAAAALDALPQAQRYPIAASLPDFLSAKFQETFGAEANAAAEAMNERAPLTARVNLLKGSREELQRRLAEEGVESTPTPLSPLGLWLETRVNVFALQSFKDGLLELQDEGSQLLGMLVDAPPTRVVDACAGAGGKTLQLATQMKNRGDLHALDVDEGRIEELRKRARRAGVHNVRTQVIPPEGPAAAEALVALKDKADRVLVDAPCSGTGTYRRKPDGRYRLTPDELREHASRQKALLERFATMVKPGGRLIYGTCSVLREENEAVIDGFLSRHPEFSVRPVSQELGAELGEKVSQGPFLRLAPHTHNTDGFFGAILVRAK